MARSVKQKLVSVALARKLRKTSTPAEKRLWTMLRDRQLHGVKFRRQYPYRQFIFDFYSTEIRLAIEVDGGIHATDLQADRDQIRTDIAIADGIRILRFPNERVLSESDVVLGEITAAIKKTDHTQ